ncbi:MAG: protein-S-isoprenylcysteine O-methyltransferase Ste14 [Halioglobus sp.]|jgi:protein-S-isoprenylcysteine O-methyltransferase Ste14
MDDLLKLFLPVYFSLFFGVAFLWRTWRTWKMTGINPYRLLGNHGPELVVSRYFRILPLMSLVVMVMYLLPPGFYQYLVPITWLYNPMLQVAGVALMSVALLWMVVAQGQMGASWRIGVDYESHTEFVQRGLFRYSRNPIFLGVMLSVVGFFLLLPNALTLLIMVLDLLVIQVQISIEEQYLAEEHGEVYEGYCSDVRRWL